MNNNYKIWFLFYMYIDLVILLLQLLSLSVLLSLSLLVLLVLYVYMYMTSYLMTFKFLILNWSVSYFYVCELNICPCPCMERDYNSNLSFCAYYCRWIKDKQKSSKYKCFKWLSKAHVFVCEFTYVLYESRYDMKFRSHSQVNF